VGQRISSSRAAAAGQCTGCHAGRQESASYSGVAEYAGCV
jgi:cytochrome c553